uniref:DUF2931 family protein n=2 Tax=Flavobacterium sp. TaxID=239 RepID=UPI004049A6B1
MKEKIIIILSSLLLFGCQNEEKFIWEAAMSRPAYYVFTGPHLFYLRNGEIIGSSATLTDIDGSWSKWDTSRGANYSGMMPDSVVVDYYGLNQKLETCHYRGGMSLPTQELEAMFRKGYIDEKGKAKKHERIITGMAPGGRICVWVDRIEIKRGIVEQGEIYSDHPIVFFGDSIETNNYLKHHPVDYTLWEKPDPRYELDFGFCSEDRNYDVKFLYTFSREGTKNRIYYADFDRTFCEQYIGMPSNYIDGQFYVQKNEKLELPTKLQLPVHLKFSWFSETNDIVFYTDIVLPENFAKRFTTPYLNTQRVDPAPAQFNRLVFGVEKDGEHCIIWLDGPGKQEKLMRFKGCRALITPKNFIESGGYATEVEYFDPE